jgi:hypothetical protein
LRFNVFYYGITGAIVSYYFSHLNITPLRFSLLFPVIMSLSFGVAFVWAAGQLKLIKKDLFAIRDTLGLMTAPDVGVLVVFLWISAVTFFLVAIGLLLLFVWSFCSPAFLNRI